MLRRFIPARAGNGAGAAHRAVPASVHPRARGERVADRGDRRPISRFIPARAGNGSDGSSSLLRRAGSSPRARGTVVLPSPLQACSRFIPARAGNGPEAGRSHGGRRRFIPARAGNGFAERPGASPRRGSSPRARGTVRRTAPRRATSVHPRARGERTHHGAWRACNRFIPARAGNGARRSTDDPSVTGSSPRARGTELSSSGRPNSAGSSPRARGTAIGLSAPAGSWRFIPARAGNGPLCYGSIPEHAVHPRARGERRSRIAAWAKLPVHPRACGERRMMTSLVIGIGRFIPAPRGTAASRDVISARSVHPRAAGNGPRCVHPA